jgi:hypothetical protein
MAGTAARNQRNFAFAQVFSLNELTITAKANQRTMSGYESD